MSCDAYCLLRSIDADANTLQMLTEQVSLWTENAAVVVSWWAAEMVCIGQEKSGLTTQWKDNKVRAGDWEIVQSMSSNNKLGNGTEQWDLLITCCTTRISDQASQCTLWKRNLADKRILDSQYIMVALHQPEEVGLCGRYNRINEALTQK